MKALLYLLLFFSISKNSISQENDSIDPEINKLFFNLLRATNLTELTSEIQNTKAKLIDTPISQLNTKVFIASEYVDLTTLFEGISKVFLVSHESEAPNQNIFSIAIKISFNNSVSKEQVYKYHKQLRKIFTKYYKYERNNNFWAEKGTYLSFGNMQFSTLHPFSLNFPKKTNDGFFITYSYDIIKQ